MDAIETTFRNLCRPSSVEDLRRLSARVETHAEAVVERSLSDPEAQATIAEDLSAVLRKHISRADQLSDDKRSTLRGAIEYFLLTSDVDDDMSPHGMEDDLKVIEILKRELEA